MSVRTYTDKQLAEMNAKELETHTWKGKEYNAYQATQYQRKMETTMRAQRSTVRELQRGDGDKDTIEQAKARYQGMLHQYNKFSRTMKLEPQMERVYLDGLGRVVNTGYHKKTNTGGEKHVIIKAQKTTPYATPDSITQITGKQGGTTRNYYDSDGKWYKQISNNNHGNAKHHPYGKNGEHAHDILWDNDKIVSRPTRELTDRERKENKDIL